MSKSEIVRFVARFTMEACRCMTPNGNRPPEAPGWSDAGRIANDALALLRLASQHKRLCELDCSVASEPNEVTFRERADRVEDKIAALLNPYGMGVTFSGDPRGATVKLILPSGYTDDMGRDGFCVPQVGYSAAQIDRMAK